MLINHCLSSYWKEAVIERIPKKNFTIEDLSTLCDISLLSVCYKILSKAICNEIILIILSKIDFWQRAFLNKSDCQELIYTLKTAIEDFHHKSTKFTSVFIDFAYAFGSVNHQFLFETLQLFDIPDIYNCLIEDLYKYSSFKVICGSNLTKIFIIVRGTKTGDPLSALIFILIIERTCRPMVEIAILKLGIRNELRFNPLPVQAFADDIVLSSYDIEVIKSMLRESEPVMLSAGLEVKTSKCAAFHDCLDQAIIGTKVEKMIHRKCLFNRIPFLFANEILIINILESHYPFVEKMKNKLMNLSISIRHW